MNAYTMSGLLGGISFTQALFSKTTACFYQSALRRLRTSRSGFDNGVCLRDALGFGRMKRRRVDFQWLTRGFHSRTDFASLSARQVQVPISVATRSPRWWSSSRTKRAPMMETGSRSGPPACASGTTPRRRWVAPRRRRTHDASLGASGSGSQALWLRASGVLSAVILGLVSGVSLALNDAIINEAAPRTSDSFTAWLVYWNPSDVRSCATFIFSRLADAFNVIQRDLQMMAINANTTAIG